MAKRLIIILIIFSLLLTGTIYLVLTKRDKRLWGVRNAAKFRSIQAALNDLPDSGGKVFVPPGTYIITLTIEMKSNQALIGSGPSSIITTQTENIDLIHCYNIDGSRLPGVSISNLYLLGMDKGTGSAIKVKGSHNSVFENLWITKTYYGIYFVADRKDGDNTDNNLIANNSIVDTISHGIYFNPESASRSEDNIIQGNLFAYTGGEAIRISPGKRNTIIGNTIEDAGKNGILLRGGHKNTVVGNTVNECKKHGIHVKNEDHSIISNNIFYGNGTRNTNSYDGIHISKHSDYITVIGNSCIDNDRFGIYISDANCDKSIILGNIATGNRTSQIVDNGANTDKGHNQSQ